MATTPALRILSILSSWAGELPAVFDAAALEAATVPRFGSVSSRLDGRFTVQLCSSRLGEPHVMVTDRDAVPARRRALGAVAEVVWQGTPEEFERARSAVAEVRALRS